jgi:hypothetical protein
MQFTSIASARRPFDRYIQGLASPLETVMQHFQIITWSLFGVLLIAYIAVKMSKRRKNT